MITLSPQSLTMLQNSKNLLAFSGGTDSSALFFVLMQYNITFDLAIVDYNIREQSKKEVQYAQDLCKTYHKQCHIFQAPKISTNFEAQARHIRYHFFHTLLDKYHYHNLVMAHHFDDKLEWFFMRFTHGSGLNTLLGFNEIESFDTAQGSYYLIRPLIRITKQEILHYNQTHKIQYFHDESNDDTKYLRNFFRHSIVGRLTQFSKGMQKSIDFLTREYNKLYLHQVICHDNNLFYCKNHDTQIHTIDKLCKKYGYVMSEAQKQEVEVLLQRHKDCIIGDKIVIAKSETLLYVGIHAAWLLEHITHYPRQNRFIRFPNIAKLHALLSYEYRKRIYPYFASHLLTIYKDDLAKHTFAFYINHSHFNYLYYLEFMQIILHTQRLLLSNASLSLRIDTLRFYRVESYMLQYYCSFKSRPINQQDSYNIHIPKTYRNNYRIQKIPHKIRPILYLNSLDIW